MLRTASCSCATSLMRSGAAPSFPFPLCCCCCSCATSLMRSGAASPFPSRSAAAAAVSAPLEVGVEDGVAFLRHVSDAQRLPASFPALLLLLFRHL